jgi:predicted aldo/keto reductase-like oxidoreductase
MWIAMLTRKMQNVRAPLSILGSGAMRLPTTQEGKINEPEAIRMIRYAIDNGLNYEDTTYQYHDGAGEPLVGKALLDRYRDRRFLARNCLAGLSRNARTWTGISISSWCGSGPAISISTPSTGLM